MGDESKVNRQDQEKTRVDLGEDLLKEGGAYSFSVDEENIYSVRASETPQDFFQNAKILANEGLIEDAKQVLRKILIVDPHHVDAKKKLEELVQEELRQILSVDHIQPRYRSQVVPSVQKIDTAHLIDELDRILMLNLQAPSSLQAGELEKDFLRSDEGVTRFLEALEKQSSGLPVSQWLDLGIAFLEMEYPLVSLKFFEKAFKKIDRSASDSIELLLSVVSLLALTYIREQRPVEAISILQSLLRDEELHRKDKVELLYLLGRAHELTSEAQVALKYYQNAIEICPRYRDSEKRIRKLL